MPVAMRILSSALVLLGLATTVFFWLLFAITDCSLECVAQGERAVPLAFVGTGLGIAVGGVVLLWTLTWRRALAWGLLVAGAIAALAIVWIMATEGSRGQATWLVGLAVIVALGGAALVRANPPRPA